MKFKITCRVFNGTPEPISFLIRHNFGGISKKIDPVFCSKKSAEKYVFRIFKSTVEFYKIEILNKV
jgi:hypothetical protein